MLHQYATSGTYPSGSGNISFIKPSQPEKPYYDDDIEDEEDLSYVKERKVIKNITINIYLNDN